MWQKITQTDGILGTNIQWPWKMLGHWIGTGFKVDLPENIWGVKFGSLVPRGKKSYQFLLLQLHGMLLLLTEVLDTTVEAVLRAKTLENSKEETCSSRAVAVVQPSRLNDNTLVRGNGKVLLWNGRFYVYFDVLPNWVTSEKELIFESATKTHTFADKVCSFMDQLANFQHLEV